MSEDLSHFQSFVVIAGLSGAGKSTASKAFSDSGFYAIDNLPVALLPHFLKLSRLNAERFLKTSLLIDVHSTGQRELLFGFLDSLKDGENSPLHLLFLDATTQSLVQRYSETRRPHPLFNEQKDMTLEDAIQRERELLIPIRERAALVIDSSDLTPHDLRRRISGVLGSLDQVSTKKLRVNFQSFGFKYGVPTDCDLLIDVRFLPNPYFVDELREKTGMDEEVREYVLETPEAKQFVEKYTELLHFLLPQYSYEGKAYLKIGVGCTGGKHRSVSITRELAESIPSDVYALGVMHRDIGK